MAYFRTKVIVKLTKSFKRVSVSRVCMPNMKSVSVIVQKLWPRLKFLATD